VPARIAACSRAAATAGVMWSSFGDYEIPVMHLAPWDEKLAVEQGAMHVCGEGCAQKLQSQFMDNVLANRSRKTSG